VSRIGIEVQFGTGLAGDLRLSTRLLRIRFIRTAEQTLKGLF